MNIVFGVVTVICVIVAILGVVIAALSTYGIILTAMAQMDGESVSIKDYLEDVVILLLGAIVLAFGLMSATGVRHDTSMSTPEVVVIMLFCIIVGAIYKRRTMIATEEDKSKLEIWRRRSIWVTMLAMVMSVIAITFLPLITGDSAQSYPEKNKDFTKSTGVKAESDFAEDSASTEELEPSLVPVDLSSMMAGEYLEKWEKYLSLSQINESMSAMDKKRLEQTEDKYDLPLEFKYEKDLNKEEEVRDETNESLFGNAYASFQLNEGWGRHKEILEAVPDTKQYSELIDSAYTECRDTTTREVVKNSDNSGSVMGMEYFLTMDDKKEIIHTKEFQQYTAVLAEVLDQSEYKGVQERTTKIIFGLPYKGQDDNSLRRAIARTKPEEQVTREFLVFETKFSNGFVLEWGLSRWSKDYAEFAEPSTTITRTTEQYTPPTAKENPPETTVDEPEPTTPSGTTPVTPVTPATPITPVTPNEPVVPGTDKVVAEDPSIQGQAPEGGGESYDKSQGSNATESVEQNDYATENNPRQQETVQDIVSQNPLPQGTESTGTGGTNNTGTVNQNGGVSYSTDSPMDNTVTETITQQWDSSASAQRSDVEATMPD